MKSKIFAICLGVIGVSTLAVAEGHSSNSSTPSDSGDRNVSVRIADGSNGVKFVFTRDRSIPALGKAWKDPSGMIWGDIVRTALGTVNEMDYSSAVEYCKRINAKLPSKEDFVRLREYMGAIPGGYFPEVPPGYKPQVLRHLSRHFFWSSSIPERDISDAYIFDGRSGSIGLGSRYYYDNALRCVSKN